MANIKIAGKLVPGTSDGVLAGTDAVKDDSLNMFQNGVNALAVGNGVFNVTEFAHLQRPSFLEAVSAVPSGLWHFGMVITYQDEDDAWVAKQFTGDDVTDWTDEGSWEDFGGGGGGEFVPVTSEEVAAMDDP